MMCRISEPIYDYVRLDKDGDEMAAKLSLQPYIQARLCITMTRPVIVRVSMIDEATLYTDIHGDDYVIAEVGDERKAWALLSVEYIGSLDYIQGLFRSGS